VRPLTRLLVPEEPNDEREEFECEVPLESQVFDEVLDVCDWELSEIKSDSTGELTKQTIHLFPIKYILYSNKLKVE
jgi:hypothetical protein